MKLYYFNQINFLKYTINFTHQFTRWKIQFRKLFRRVPKNFRNATQFVWMWMWMCVCMRRKTFLVFVLCCYGALFVLFIWWVQIDRSVFLVQGYLQFVLLHSLQSVLCVCICDLVFFYFVVHIMYLCTFLIQTWSIQFSIII